MQKFTIVCDRKRVFWNEYDGYGRGNLRQSSRAEVEKALRDGRLQIEVGKIGPLGQSWSISGLIISK